MTSEHLPRKFVAILYADVAGYNRLIGEDDWDSPEHDQE
jgi:hypothetical protein